MDKPWELTGEDVDRLPIPKAAAWRRINDHEWRTIAQDAQHKAVIWLVEVCLEHEAELIQPRRFNCPSCVKALKAGLGMEE